MFTIFNRRTLTVLALASSFVFGSAPVWADNYSEVSRMMRAGQLGPAASKVDQLLAAKPKDPQLRFFKGVIQSEQGRTQEAINTFSKLSQDYPELPEPYNNLAVLYANQSQFDKARAALEMAIRTNPSYATAHENLGDVYAKLASQAYSKALQLDTNNSGVQPKLALIKEMFSPGTAAPVAVATRAPAATAAPVAVATRAPAATAAPVAVTRAPAAATVAPAAQATKVPVATAAPATATPTAAPAVASGENAAIESAVRAWAQAWSSKNMNAYYAAYSANFKPTGGQSRKAWEADRKARIVSKKNIEVNLSNVRVEMKGADQAVVRFHQDYRGDALRARANKSLAMAKEGGRWMIVQELVR